MIIDIQQYMWYCISVPIDNYLYERSFNND
nr:MAG TPA: hypothetical protein [Caudoviricetes sp.]